MQYELNLRDYLRIFQKRRWIIILMPVLAGLMGYVFTPVPDVYYEASGRFRVTQRIVPSRALFDAYYYWEEGSILATHAQVITSREVLKETAASLGLLPPDITDDALILNADYIGIVDDLSSSISAEPIPQTSIIRITCLRPRRGEAVRWTNALLDTYAEIHTYDLNRAVIESVDYIETQLEVYDAALRASENELAAFKLEFAESISLSVDKMADTQRELEEADFELRTLSIQVDILDDALATGTIPSLDLLTHISTEDPKVLESLTLLTNLQRDRQQLLSYQTLRSPEVRNLEEEIRSSVTLLRARLLADRGRLLAERDLVAQKFVALPENDVILARLARDVDLNNRTYTLLREEYERARLREAESAREINIIERAMSAMEVSETGRSSKAMVAALIGLLLGVVLALILESLDTSIGAIEDVETLLQLPVVGIVPPINFDGCQDIIGKVAPQLLDHRDIERLSSLVVHYDPRSPVSEAYRSLRTNIEQIREETGSRVMILTSSVLEEGKTTTAANLALAFAQMGRKTLLLTADLRRPDIHKIFGLPKDPGLADVLTGSVDWKDAVRGLSDMLLGELSMDVVMLTPGMDNLQIMPAGTNPLNPAELLSSHATGSLMDELREEYDVILIDAPPVIPVTDAAIMAEHADGVLMVYEVGKVGRDVLKRAVNHLDSVRAKVWGIVMNDIRAEGQISLRDADYQYYRYRYERSSSANRFGRSGARANIPLLGRWLGRRGR
jgi:succinoglycan biosynthesis transport protein ExoP